MALPDSLHGLMDKAAYPHPCDSIELIETHISWVLLTGEFAYKLKKPVKFSFLDFSTLELREHFCREELRCNRTFAPSLYVDVVPVYLSTDGSVGIGGEPATDSTVLEWAVQMRQFDPAAQLDRLLEQDGVTADMLRNFGHALAATHAQLPQLKDGKDLVEAHTFAPVSQNFTEIEATKVEPNHKGIVTRTRQLSEDLGVKLRPLLEARTTSGFVRECHGDLHLSNLVLIDNTVVAFDCLEFNATLRWIDTMSDVAFLFMDCDERERAGLAYAFLNGYLDASGDYQGAELLGYFAAYRSVVRAKVAALRWDQEPSQDVEARFVQHMEWARDRLEQPPGKLILMCGLSGSGKSYVAKRLAPLLPAVHVRSDVARKTLAGLDAMDRTDSPVGQGLYAPDRSDKVYAYLAETAATLAQTGENVIADATFLSRAQRAAFLQTAANKNLDAKIVYCTAPVEVLESRVEQRAKTDNDPSEATTAVLDAQLAKFEPPGADEPVIELATDQSLSASVLREQLKTLFI